MGEGLTLLSPHRPGGNPKKTFRGCVPGKMKRLGHVLNDFFSNKSAKKFDFFQGATFLHRGVQPPPCWGRPPPPPSLNTLPWVPMGFRAAFPLPARQRRPSHVPGILCPLPPTPATAAQRWATCCAARAVAERPGPLPRPTSHPCDGRTLGHAWLACLAWGGVGLALSGSNSQPLPLSSGPSSPGTIASWGCHWRTTNRAGSEILGATFKRPGYRWRWKYRPSRVCVVCSFVPRPPPLISHKHDTLPCSAQTPKKCMHIWAYPQTDSPLCTSRSPLEGK